MGTLFPSFLFFALQLQHSAAVLNSQWDHFDALNNLQSFHEAFRAEKSSDDEMQDSTQQTTQANENSSTPISSATDVVLDDLPTVPSAPAPAFPSSSQKAFELLSSSSFKPRLPLSPLEPLTPAKKEAPSTFLIELGTSTKRSSMTLGTSAAAEARAETRAALQSLSAERDYYSQQYAGELSRSSALSQRLQMVQAELNQEQEKEAQQSQAQAQRLKALQAQVQADQKDMSYQAAWVVQAGDKKLKDTENDASLWKNRSLVLAQELKEARNANKLEKAKEVWISRKVDEMQRQNEDLIIEEQDHDQEMNKSQSNLEYAQKQIRQEEKLLKQSKQHSLALEAKLQLLQGASEDWKRQHFQDQQENARLQSELKNAGSYGDRRIQGVITRASKMAQGFQSSERAWATKNQHLEASLLQANSRIASLQGQVKKKAQTLDEEKNKYKKVKDEMKSLRKKDQELESDADSRQGLEENVDGLEQQNHALEQALHAAQEDGGRSREQLAELQEQNLELSRDLEAAKLQLKHQGTGKYQLALIDLSSGGNTGTKDTNPEAEVNDLFRTDVDPLGSNAPLAPVAKGTSFLDISRSVASIQSSPQMNEAQDGLPRPSQVSSSSQGSQPTASLSSDAPMSSVSSGDGDALSEVEQLLH